MGLRRRPGFKSYESIEAKKTGVGEAWNTVEAGAEPLGRTARRQRAKVAAVARLSQRVAAADAWARRKSRLSEQERSSRGRSRRRRQFGG